MTPKQQRFVSEYLVDLNATQAAKRAGYSPRTANEQGARLLANVSVRSAIAEAKASRAERTQIDADWVLRRLATEVNADLADLYDENGNLRHVREWPMVWRTGLITGVETVQERDGDDAEGNPKYVTVKKIKLSERLRHTELIGRHVDVAAFKDKMEINVVGIADRMKRAEGRVK